MGDVPLEFLPYREDRRLVAAYLVGSRRGDSTIRLAEYADISGMIRAGKVVSRAAHSPETIESVESIAEIRILRDSKILLSPFLFFPLLSR